MGNIYDSISGCHSTAYLRLILSVSKCDLVYRCAINYQNCLKQVVYVVLYIFFKYSFALVLLFILSKWKIFYTKIDVIKERLKNRHLLRTSVEKIYIYANVNCFCGMCSVHSIRMYYFMHINCENPICFSIVSEWIQTIKADKAINTTHFY